jgi:hypothetical protein
MKIMNESEILALGFKKNEWTSEGNVFTEYLLKKNNITVEISGLTLVEISFEDSNFYFVDGCNTISDLENLINLFNLK